MPAIILAIIRSVLNSSKVTIQYLQCIMGDEISFTIVRWYFMAQDRIYCYKVLNSDGYFAIKGRVNVCYTLLWLCLLCDVGFFLS